jgi:ligand-binding sensor domain-containing protein/signal transduction histidine kinase
MAARALPLLLFLLLWLAQAPALAAPPRTLNFESLGVKEGLAQETVTAIVQDQQGFMWFGSQHGLSRYDGNRVVVYRTVPHDARSLSDNWVQALHVDKKNRLWVGTRGGLQRFDPDSGGFTTFLAPDSAGGAGKHHVQAIISDGYGQLWIGTNDGVQHFDPESGRFTVHRHRPGDAASLAHNQVNALALDADGALWVGLKRGLDRLAAGASAFEHFRVDSAQRPSAPMNEVQLLRVDQHQVLWIVTMDGLVSWPLASAGRQRHVFSAADGLPPSLITALLQDRDNTLWLGTNTSGLHRWDAQRQRFVAIPVDPHQLAGSEVSTLFQDHTGTLWVGTWTAGAKRVDLASGGFSRYFHQPGDARSLHDNRVYGICSDGKGGLLLAGFGGIDRLDPRSGDITRLRTDARLASHMRNNELVLAVHRDARGQLWIGTSAELGRFDPASGAFHPHAFAGPDPNSGSITHIGGDRAGNLWVGSRGGLHRIDAAGGADRSYRHDPQQPASLADDWVRMSLEDGDGRIWVATDNGLDLLDPASGAFRHFRHDPADAASLSSDRVQFLFRDSRGTLWVGTNGGLNRMRRGAGGAIGFRSYTTRDGLGADSIGGILEADDGQLWLATASGISRMDPGRDSFKNFTARDGMIEGYYFSGSAYRDADGGMYFGGVNGLTAFHPDRIGANPYPPPAVLTGLRVGNTPLPPDSNNLNLEHTASSLRFEFAALHFADPPHNRYRYQLQGFDRDWRDSDAGNASAGYTNLDPGHYVFRVKAANKDGVWGESAPPVSFDIAPPPWQRWWFQLPLGLGLMLLVWTIDRLRTRMHARRRLALEQEVQARTAEVQQQKQALELAQAQLQGLLADRERLFISISHDLRTPINRLKFRAELLDDEVVREEFHDDLDDLSMMVKGAMETVKNSGINEQPAPVALDALFARVQRGAELGGHRFSYTPAGLAVLAKPLALRRAIGNLVDNAICYGGAVDVGMTAEDGAVHIRIRDHGPGVPESQLGQLFDPHLRLDHGRARNADGLGLGLGIARAIIAADGGSLRLENHPDGGLVAHIVLPAAFSS